MYLHYVHWFVFDKPIFVAPAFIMSDLGVQVSVRPRPSVRPSVRLSVYIYPGCLVSATPLLYRTFWNFACVFFMVWGCACDLDIIVRLFFVTFSTLWIKSFFTSIDREWVPLVSATLLTVLYWLFWNFACVFFMVWGYACGLGISVRTFIVTFSILWTYSFFTINI